MRIGPRRCRNNPPTHSLLNPVLFLRFVVLKKGSSRWLKGAGQTSCPHSPIPMHSRFYAKRALSNFQVCGPGEFPRWFHFSPWKALPSDPRLFLRTSVAEPSRPSGILPWSDNSALVRTPGHTKIGFENSVGKYHSSSALRTKVRSTYYFRRVCFIPTWNGDSR